MTEVNMTLAEHKATAVISIKQTMRSYRLGIISLGELYHDIGKALVAYEQTIANADQGPVEPTIWSDTSNAVLYEAGWNHEIS